MADLTNQLEEVKAAAERLTLKRIRENAEEQGLPVPPRAAHGNTVLPKEEKLEVEEVAGDSEETNEGSYEARTDKNGNTFFVGPNGKRVSKEDYEANVEKEDE